MRNTTLWTIAIAAVFLFITLGDRLLPAPLDAVSLKTRTQIDQFLLGLFPDKDVENPNKNLSDQAEKFEDAARSKR